MTRDDLEREWMPAEPEPEATEAATRPPEPSAADEEIE